MQTRANTDRLETDPTSAGHARQADAGNWQARGQEFEVGQSVRLCGAHDTDEGRVVATWPGIGMVDVQWSHTTNRHPVEDLQIVSAGDDPFVSPRHEDVPGGPGTLDGVSSGATQNNFIEREEPRVEDVREVNKKAATDMRRMALRVAAAFVKKSLYWHARDRKYRVSREEHDTGAYHCPSRGCSGTMRQATYKMENGCKVKLHACPSCLFMIRSADIMADHCGAPEESC
jgi:hypothetical protein